MAVCRRSALNGLRRLKTPQQQRFASHDAHHDSHSHGHHEGVTEPLGGTFWALLAVPPAIYFLYENSKPNKANEQPFLTQWMATFDEWREENKERNVLHAKLVDQAAADRILFLHSAPPTPLRRVPVRNLEMINARDPFNHQAGWGTIDLEKLQAHVESENKKQDDINLERYKKILEGTSEPKTEPVRKQAISV